LIVTQIFKKFTSLLVPLARVSCTISLQRQNFPFATINSLMCTLHLLYSFSCIRLASDSRPTCYIRHGDWTTNWTVRISTRVFSSTNSPDRFWGPRRLHFSGYCGLFPEQSGRDLKLTTYLHLEPRSRMGGDIPLIHLYVFVECTEKNLALLPIRNYSLLLSL